MYFSVLVKMRVSRDKTQLTDIPFFLSCIRSRRKIWKKVEDRGKFGQVLLLHYSVPVYPYQWLMQEQLLPALLRARQDEGCHL